MSFAIVLVVVALVWLLVFALCRGAAAADARLDAEMRRRSLADRGEAGHPGRLVVTGSIPVTRYCAMQKTGARVAHGAAIQPPNIWVNPVMRADLDSGAPPNTTRVQRTARRAPGRFTEISRHVASP